MDIIDFVRLQQYDLTREQLISFRILNSEINKRAKESSRGNICPICKNVCFSFCNSHSIPKYVLREIAFNGMVWTGSDISGPAIANKPDGINRTLVFNSICEHCDNTYFKEYETPIVQPRRLSDVEINEIAVKNLLRYIYKRKNDFYRYQILAEKNPFIPGLPNQVMLASLDVKEYDLFLKQLISKKTKHFFYIIDEIDLDYNVQFAYQGFTALINGFDSQIINDVYNYDFNYKIQRLGIAVFPYKNTTKIVLFCKEGDSRLRLFYKQYKKLPLEKKLYVINYLILLYEEEWCVSASFNQTKLNQETLNIIKQTQNTLFNTDNPFISEDDIDKAIRRKIVDEKLFVLKTEGNIFNFLKKEQ